MAPVTLLVPNELAGITARRSLATGVLPGTTGVAGLYISTLPRLAEQLAAASLSPRVPATRAFVAAAWRTALNDDPGVFSGVKDHVATIRALTDAHRDLRDLDEDALDAVAASGALQHSLIDLHRTVSAARRKDTAMTRWSFFTPPRGGSANVPTRSWARSSSISPSSCPMLRSTWRGSWPTQLGLTVLAGLVGDAKADAVVLRDARGPWTASRCHDSGVPDCHRDSSRIRFGRRSATCGSRADRFLDNDRTATDCSPLRTFDPVRQATSRAARHRRPHGQRTGSSRRRRTSHLQRLPRDSRTGTRLPTP